MDKEPRHDLTPEERIKMIVDSAFEACRANVYLYDSPSGIKISVGDIVWAIAYWPAYDDYPDSLRLTRDVQEYKRPVAYSLEHDGQVIKNATVERRISGGVYFDASAYEIVDDVHEVETLNAIILATHQLHS